MTSAQKTVSVIGAGIMGSAITRRLLERGWNVSVYDLDVAKLAPLAPISV
jgi:2-hydroxy-3-oxopropionate reductase